MKRKMAALLAACMLLVQGAPEVTVYAAETGNTEENAPVDILQLLGEAGDKLQEAFEGIDSETAMEIFDFVGEKLSDGSLKTQEGLSDALREGEERFGIAVEKADAQKVVDTMEKLEELGFSGEYMIEKTKELYQEYGADFVAHVNEAVAGTVQQAVEDTAAAFFENLWESVKDFCESLFSGL